MLSFGRTRQYEAARSQLERQTAALLAERRQLEQHQQTIVQKRSSNNQIEVLLASLTPAVNKMEQSAKKQELVSRLQQIIQLCKDEGSLTSEEMKEILKVQNQVQNYVQKSNLEEVPKFVDPDEPPASSRQPKIRTVQSELNEDAKSQSNQRQQLFKKPQQVQKVSRISLSQDTLDMISQIERKALGQIIRLQSERDQIKLQRDQLLVQTQQYKKEPTPNNYGQIQRLNEENKLIIQQNYELKTQLKAKVEKQNNQQNQIHKKLKEVNNLLIQQNQDLKNQLNGLIAEIQENKNSKVNASRTNGYAQQGLLNKKLKEENRLLAQQNYELKSQLDVISLQRQKNQSHQVNTSTQQYPYNEGLYIQSKQNFVQGQFDSQIAVYQNQLIRAAAVIQELSKRLQNVPGLEELRAQGEQIRRQTTELLKRNKHGVTTDSRLIRELQQRLDEQEKVKALFLQELKVFKQRFTELEEQNEALKRTGRISFNPDPQPLGTTTQRDSRVNLGILKKKTAGIGDYQKTINQLRQALN